MTARYSGKALVEKLGYKPGETVLLFNAPGWFEKYVRTSGNNSKRLVLDNTAITPAVKPRANWVQAFITSLLELDSFCQRIDLSQVEKGWWVSWPKKSSGVPTDLTEQTFRD